MGPVYPRGSNVSSDLRRPTFAVRPRPTWPLVLGIDTSTAQAPRDQDATLLAGNGLEQEDMRAVRRHVQDCTDRARVPLSEPDYGNMSLDDAAPQASTALVTAALPSITNCELTNVKGNLACSFHDSYCDFNCVIARIQVDHTCQRSSSSSTSLTTSEIRVVVISPCITSFAAGLVRAGYPCRH